MHTDTRYPAHDVPVYTANEDKEREVERNKNKRTQQNCYGLFWAIGVSYMVFSLACLACCYRLFSGFLVILYASYPTFYWSIPVYMSIVSRRFFLPPIPTLHLSFIVHIWWLLSGEEARLWVLVFDDNGYILVVLISTIVFMISFLSLAFLLLMTPLPFL